MQLRHHPCLPDPEREGDGRVSFSQFLRILQNQYPPPSPSPSPNARTIQFLHILEEYRLTSEAQGNYLETQRIQTQLEILRNYEESRQQNAIQAQQIQEKWQMEKLHQEQYLQFELSWDQFMTNFEEKAQQFFMEMIQQHSVQIGDFQKKLEKEMLSKPPKWSRELLDWRKRQHILAKQKNYAEAQKIKAISDALEREERGNMNSNYTGSLAKREANLRALQMAERAALEKRIQVRRRELAKRRETDCQRLKQRNRNLMAALESKQISQNAKQFLQIKTNMTNELKSVKVEMEKRQILNAKPTVKRKKKVLDS